MPNVVDRLSGASSSLAFKAPCRLATTANITLSGYQTIDGVLPTSSEHADLRRILVKDKTATADNGIYIMDTGAWTRTKDFDGANDFRTGTRIYVYAGSTQSGTYIVTSSMDPDTFDIDTDTITIAEAGTFDQTTSALGIASGGVISFNSGDVTITHSANALAFAGASSGYTFDSGITASSAVSVTGTITASSAVNVTGAITASSAVTVAGTLTVNGAAVSSAITASGPVLVNSLAVTGASGSEGGELTLAVPSTGHTLNGTSVTVDISANFFRVFESGSPFRGIYVDLSACATNAGAPVGPTSPVNATSATTNTDLLAYGISVISSAETTWRMDAPVPGLIKHIFRGSTTTGTTGTITLESGSILSSAASTANSIAMTGGCGLSLVGVSTSVYAIVSRFPTTGQINIT